MKILGPVVCMLALSTSTGCYAYAVTDVRPAADGKSVQVERCALHPIVIFVASFPCEHYSVPAAPTDSSNAPSSTPPTR